MQKSDLNRAIAIQRNFFEICLKFIYLAKKAMLGKSPVFFALKVMKTRAKSPQTFNEKILYKLTYDRRELLTLVADKLTVRDYVSARIGNEYLTNVFEVYNQESQISIDMLPRNFVLKPNHASGAALIVGDFVPVSQKLNYTSKQIFKKYYTNYDNLTQSHVTNLVKFWFSTDYYAYHRLGYPEWAYKGIPRSVYAEELLSENGQPPRDYRFLIFNGHCSVVMVDTPGYGGVKRDLYTPDWEKMPVKFGWDGSDSFRERPIKLTEMIRLAETLGKEFDHIRVDFYNVGERIIFGEMTNYHAGGSQKFVPSQFDRLIGNDWKPENIY